MRQTALHNRASIRIVRALGVVLAVLMAGSVLAAGTPAGTVISNVAEVTFNLNGTTTTQSSNVVSITVVERIDVLVTLQSSQALVAANDVDRSLLFTVTNSGNGSETMTLAINSNLTGDDFDPVPAVPAIYFDTDSSGDFSAGDVAYSPGTNDPVIAADASTDILLVNDIPGTVINGQLGRSELTATSTTGTGNPGDPFPGQGDFGTDAVIGNTGGQASVFGEYLVSDVQIDIVKSVLITDPFGNQDPLPGATMTYTVTVQVTNGGTATAATFNDAIPVNTTYTPNTIFLNTVLLTDAIDGDEGEYDPNGTPAVVVRFGDLTQARGIQTIEFQVTIN